MFGENLWLHAEGCVYKTGLKMLATKPAAGCVAEELEGRWQN